MFVIIPFAKYVFYLAINGLTINCILVSCFIIQFHNKFKFQPLEY